MTANKNDVIYDVHDKPPVGMWVGLSFQHLFAMFGATVLVPILVGIDPAIALFSSGLGTLAHLSVTKYKIPAYMGSSFAYILAMQSLMKSDGIAAVAQGAVVGGFVYLLVALIVKFVGKGWIDKVLPPIVVGPIVMVIGLSLAGTAVNDAMNKNGEYNLTFLMISLVTLFAVLAFNMFGKGLTSLIPILLGIIVGYVFTLIVQKITGTTIISFDEISKSAWLDVPKFDIMFVDYHFKLYPSAILTMAPIAFVTMTEHFGHVMVLNSLTGNDYFKDPGLDRTLTGDGLAQIIAGFFGAPPVTSYGENIGVMAVTRVYSTIVFVIAGVFAIFLGLSPKFGAVIHTIPTAILTGASIVVFGLITIAGAKIWIENKVDFSKNKNLMVAAVTIILGTGDFALQFGNFNLGGIGTATFAALILNWFFSLADKS